jgi:tetratricopeptide (TPR) repeat protein
MKRVAGLLLALSTLVPAAANAQKPSNSKETRSADVYFDNAAKSNLDSEKKEQLELALSITAEGLQKDPNNPKLWFQRGKAYELLGDIVGADTSYAKAESMYPEYKADIDKQRQSMWVTAFNNAVKKIQAGDAQAGIADLKLADKIYRGRPEALQTLGSIYLQMGDLKNAEQAYRDELTILRGPNRKGLDEKKEAEWAEAELSAVRALATMLAQQDRFADAEAMYRELLSRSPENPAVMSNLALMLSRGGKAAEANDIYAKLLSRTDLTGNQLLNVGIALHNAGQYDRAADAFTRASDMNPYSVDVLDFAVNSRSGIVDALIKEKEGKTGAAAAAVDAKLKTQYQAIISTAERALKLAPVNATMLMRLAAAQRGMSDLDAANAADWRNKVLATLQKNEALPFSITEVHTATSDKTVTLTGTIYGLAKPNSEAKLRFHLLDKDGNSVAQKEATITVPAKDERAPFSVEMDGPESAVSWKYEVL